MTTCHWSLDRLQVRINADGVRLEGELVVPAPALGTSCSSGTTRRSRPRLVYSD